MERNMGKTDIVVRLLIASCIITAYFSELTSGWNGIAALSAAAVLVLTGLSGFCPLYSLFNFYTTKKQKNDA